MSDSHKVSKNKPNKVRFQFSIAGLLVLMTIAALATPFVFQWISGQSGRISVKSNSLQSVGYNGYSKTLEVEFVNGTVYRYFKVPISVHRELMEAKSKGSYFHKNIRNGGYEFEKQTVMLEHF